MFFVGDFQICAFSSVTHIKLIRFSRNTLNLHTTDGVAHAVCVESCSVVVIILCRIWQVLGSNIGV